jgi:uncharacterized protein (TIGR03067 family)
MTRCLALFVIAVLPPLAGRPAPNAATPRDRRRLQGTWHVVALERRGRRMALPGGQLAGRVLSYTFRGDRLLIRSGNRPATEYVIKLDAAKKPRRLEGRRLPQPGITMRYLYELRGDTLRLCRAGAVGEWPAAFGTDTNPNAMILELQRQKP